MPVNACDGFSWQRTRRVAGTGRRLQAVAACTRKAGLRYAGTEGHSFADSRPDRPASPDQAPDLSPSAPEGASGIPRSGERAGGGAHFVCQAGALSGTPARSARPSGNGTRDPDADAAVPVGSFRGTRHELLRRTTGSHLPPHRRRAGGNRPQMPAGSRASPLCKSTVTGETRLSTSGMRLNGACRSSRTDRT